MGKTVSDSGRVPIVRAELVAGMSWVFGDALQALPVLRQVEGGLPREVVLVGRLHELVAVRVVGVAQGFHQGQEVVRPGDGMRAANILAVVAPEALGKSGNVGQPFARDGFPGFEVGEGAGFRVLHGSGEDKQRWLSWENDLDDDALVFDADCEVGTVFEDLYR